MDKRSTWEGFKLWMWKYIGGIVMEAKGPNNELAISIGRVSFLTVFGIMVWFWLFKEVPVGGEVVLPPYLLEVFLALAGYVFGGKFVELIKARQRKEE